MLAFVSSSRRRTEPKPLDRDVSQPAIACPKPIYSPPAIASPVCVSGVIFHRSHETQAEFAKPEVDPLEAVFAMVHGIFVNVRFPAGANGKPNFADSWSAMIDK